jgi:hypothetical protein
MCEVAEQATFSFLLCVCTVKVKHTDFVALLAPQLQLQAVACSCFALSLARHQTVSALL